MKDIEVKEKMFYLLMEWYNQDVSKLRREANTISDRINYKNEDGSLVGYRSMYIEETFYIKEEFYKSMVGE